MPAVIQRMIWENGLPVIETAVRSDALFVEDEWTWSRELDKGTPFPDREAADVQGKKLDPRAFPVIRPVKNEAAPEAVDAPLRGVRVEGTITERIHAARHNRRVADARRAISSDEVFEQTQRRFGEHE